MLGSPRESLPRVSFSGAGDGDFELGGLLGEGGMGQVHNALQRSIGREVAIKRIRPVHRENARLVEELLAEARVTGALEHPNIVPVYYLGCDRHGLPIIVMKRIDGAPWSALLDDPEHPLLSDAREDPLGRHLAILGQVCRAVHYAHSRHIVHRDLKPSNVMVGSFGEIYVVDWGLALALDPRTGCAAAAATAGTPAYMAPEMADSSLGPITGRTDVFLLGAMLYELMTGGPPWRGELVEEVLETAATCDLDPLLAGCRPAGLVEICRRAMSPDPAARYESAEALRLALESFSRRRGATSLAAHASLRLGELRALLGDGYELSPSGQARLHGLFGECRFGYQRALAEWPENQAVARERLDAYTLMIEFELSARRPGAAAVLLGETRRRPRWSSACGACSATSGRAALASSGSSTRSTSTRACASASASSCSPA